MSFLDYLCDVTSAIPIDGHRLRVTCSDGAAGVFDVTPYLDKPRLPATARPRHVQSRAHRRRRAHMARRHRHRPRTHPLRHDR